MKTILLLTTALALNGCAMMIADHIMDRQQSDKSHDAYRKCLVDNLNNPGKCEPLRVVFTIEGVK